MLLLMLTCPFCPRTSSFQAAAELSQCAVQTLTLRTPAHLLSSAKMHLLAAAIYYKHRYAVFLLHMPVLYRFKYVT